MNSVLCGLFKLASAVQPAKRGAVAQLPEFIARLLRKQRGHIIPAAHMYITCGAPVCSLRRHSCASSSGSAGTVVQLDVRAGNVPPFATRTNAVAPLPQFFGKTSSQTGSCNSRSPHLQYPRRIFCRMRRHQRAFSSGSEETVVHLEVRVGNVPSFAKRTIVVTDAKPTWRRRYGEPRSRQRLWQPKAWIWIILIVHGSHMGSTIACARSLISAVLCLLQSYLEF